MNYKETKLWLTNNIGCYHKGPQYDVLCTLIQKHPNYNQWKFNIPNAFKIIQLHAIQLHVLFVNTKRYRIVSWVQCTGKIIKKDPLTSAMRYAIKRQINQYTKIHPNKICFLCNDVNKIEVDHYPVTFVTIKNTFINNNIIPTEFNYHPKRGTYLFKPIDKVWKRKWQIYHNKCATYRYLCSRCNKCNKNIN